MGKLDAYKDIITFIVMVIFVSIWHFAMPLLALTLGRGGESQANIELFEIMGVWGLIGVMLFGALKLGEFITSRFKGKDVYRKIGWIGTVLHDPEKGFLTNIKQGGFEDQSKKTFILFRWMENPLLLFFWSIPFFTVIALVQMYKGFLLTALPKIVFQQITEFAQGILSVEPSGLEQYAPLALFGLYIHVMWWLEAIGKIPKPAKWALIFISPFLYGALWMGMHMLLHPDSQIAISYVYIFGVISSFLVVLTGSIIPSIIFKASNNLFGYLIEGIKSSAKILALTITVIFIYVMLLTIILLLIKSYKDKRANAA